VIPNFSGWSKRRVLDRCTELGIHLESSGSGVAVHQEPPPGSAIPVGESCSVIFGRSDKASGTKTVELPEVGIPEQAASQQARLRP